MFLRSGIVHRDLKPDNIFLVRSDDEELDVAVLTFPRRRNAGTQRLNQTVALVLAARYRKSIW
jgi:serine/threonine protein kinase